MHAAGDLASDSEITALRVEEAAQRAAEHAIMRAELSRENFKQKRVRQQRKVCTLC